MVDKSLNCSDILDINYAYVGALEVTLHLLQNVNTPLKINVLSIDKEMDLFKCQKYNAIQSTNQNYHCRIF